MMLAGKLGISAARKGLKHIADGMIRRQGEELADSLERRIETPGDMPRSAVKNIGLSFLNALPGINLYLADRQSLESARQGARQYERMRTGSLEENLSHACGILAVTEDKKAKLALSAYFARHSQDLCLPKSTSALDLYAGSFASRWEAYLRPSRKQMIGISYIVMGLGAAAAGVTAGASAVGAINALDAIRAASGAAEALAPAATAFGQGALTYLGNVVGLQAAMFAGGTAVTEGLLFSGKKLEDTGNEKAAGNIYRAGNIAARAAGIVPLFYYGAANGTALFGMAPYFLYGASSLGRVFSGRHSVADKISSAGQVLSEYLMPWQRISGLVHPLLGGFGFPYMPAATGISTQPVTENVAVTETAPVPEQQLYTVARPETSAVFNPFPAPRPQAESAPGWALPFYGAHPAVQPEPSAGIHIQPAPQVQQDDAREMRLEHLAMIRERAEYLQEMQQMEAARQAARDAAYEHKMERFEALQAAPAAHAYSEAIPETARQAIPEIPELPAKELPAYPAEMPYQEIRPEQPPAPEPHAQYQSMSEMARDPSLPIGQRLIAAAADPERPHTLLEAMLKSPAFQQMWEDVNSWVHETADALQGSRPMVPVGPYYMPVPPVAPVFVP